ncbi:hypothetical protein BU25DRAFT_415814 [Macroventuria anomochaeta]|uniref:Uncharacterized protein n=1 Tax=Macroventuria anomochaeta TaxID=301207 RepID=A0ACB6RK75_9PLEO|nr:uncharacterized protein BU25DRAFT_415814 [Macroventuria anomochaeta]KAF2621805.1 hypothetical protein BU25DRAFT_415814 [Macroventuria anomochaeta]
MGGPREAPAPSDTALEGAALECRFQQLGWCPHQFHRLRQICTPGTLRYLSTLDRRNYRPNEHRACRDRLCCVANNVNTKAYETAHTRTCSGSCSPVAVDDNHVVDIIRAGGVPIISIHADAASTSAEPTLHLKVTPRTISTRYTVISHVWFDGLGNPFANALPTCQVQRLHTQLLSLPRDHEGGVVDIGSLQIDWSRQSFVHHPERQPPSFWMDTLCIPVHPEHEPLRKKAINQMASIYAAAVQELVLDAELMQCEAGTGAALETLARVVCSAWMTRSWTLQEGVLARECVFQFKDCPNDPIHEWCLHGPRPTKATKALAVSFPVDEEQWAVYTELYNILWDTLHQDWKSRYRKDPPVPPAHQVGGGALSNLGYLRSNYAAGGIHTLPPVQGLSKRGQSGLDELDHFTMQLGSEHRLKQLVDTWNELAHRSTTMPEDLHVIIANLLDFNADSIMSLPTREERMRVMILSFDTLPVSLFWNTGPKWRDSRSAGAGGNNDWIPVEPSKSELSLTPVMKVSAGWLDLELGPGPTGSVPRAQILGLRENEVSISGQSSFLCAGLSELVYHVALLDAQRDEDRVADCSVPGEAPHYLIIEKNPTLLSPTSSIRGALFRRWPSQSPDRDSVVQLSYCCPVTLRPLSRNLSRGELHAVAEVLDPHTQVAVKYGQSPLRSLNISYLSDECPSLTPPHKNELRNGTAQRAS